MSARFTETLWARIRPIWDAILAHPFIRGLTTGDLEIDRFRFYVVQDALYLREFARALSVAAARSPTDDAIVMFNQHAVGALEAERSLHEGFFAEFGLHPEQVYSTPMAPTNLAYTSYLLAVAYSRPFHELLGALLPCYWIYWEVGKKLEQAGSPNRLYKRWIATYAADEFGKLVRQVLDLTDALAEKLTAGQRDALEGHFVTTSRYEWMFWDMAWRQEHWPV